MPLSIKNRLLIVFVGLAIFVPIFSYFIQDLLPTPAEIEVLEIYDYPVFLKTYRAPGLSSPTVPLGNPLGGNGFQNTEITGYYLDQGYKQEIGSDHWGIDLIPSDIYYKRSSVYLNTEKIVFFATHSGTAEYFVDEYGANYLQITNKQKTFRTLYVHMEASYIKTGEEVEVGQPIGLMGSTGKVTGLHLHYAIQTKDKNGKWVFTNPQPYIGEL